MKLNSSHIIEALAEAVAETFETMAFSEISGRIIGNTFPDLKDYSIGASIDIINPLKVHLSLVLSKKHAQEIYNTIYGEDKDNSLLSDLIAEFTNTIAGRFATAVSNKKGRVKIGLPVPIVGIFQATENEDQENQIVIIFDIENQQVVCCLEKRKNSADAYRAFSIQPLKEEGKFPNDGTDRNAHSGC